MKADIHPNYQEIKGDLRLRQRVHDSLDVGRGPGDRSLFGVPPVLYRETENRPTRRAASTNSAVSTVMGR